MARDPEARPWPFRQEPGGDLQKKLMALPGRDPGHHADDLPALPTPGFPFPLAGVRIGPETPGVHRGKGRPNLSRLDGASLDHVPPDEIGTGQKPVYPPVKPTVQEILFQDGG